MLRVFFIMLLFHSCQSSSKKPIDIAMEKGDTALAKELARQELKKIRSTITDTSFGNVMDASLLIQTLEFHLQKADTSRKLLGFSDTLITNHEDGHLLYSYMMKVYTYGLATTQRATDIEYFNKQLSTTEKLWLENKFASKKTFEALNALHFLQKDIALVTMIHSRVDSEEERSVLDRQYEMGILK